MGRSKSAEAVCKVLTRAESGKLRASKRMIGRSRFREVLEWVVSTALASQGTQRKKRQGLPAVQDVAALATLPTESQTVILIYCRKQNNTAGLVGRHPCAPSFIETGRRAEDRRALPPTGIF